MKILNQHLFFGKNNLCEKMPGKKLYSITKFILLAITFSGIEPNHINHFFTIGIEKYGIKYLVWFVGDDKRLIFVIKKMDET